jgi:hypothetical protein
MAQGDLPTPRGGLLRRRREKRQLEQLIEASHRHVSPRPTTTHVRVVEDQAHVLMEGQVDTVEPDLETPEPDLPNDGSVSRASGFHVRVVSIDQPIGE